MRKGRSDGALSPGCATRRTTRASCHSEQWIHTVKQERSTSLFEFWPTWLMYLPVALQWLLLSVRYRSLTLPLIANPDIPLAGMVGGSKDLLMSQAGGACREALLPWVLHTVNSAPVAQQAQALLKDTHEAGIALPFVCKPDMGCRGAGVKLVRNEAQLQQVLQAYPAGAGLVCQKLASFEPEVGIFYVRQPGEDGYIASLTIKHTPCVIGDGRSTLRELVARDPRAGKLLHLYESRNRAEWDHVIPDQKVHKLLFSASHCRGAVFEDARSLITRDLTRAINRIMADLPNFHYGRLDVKFRDIPSLQAGQDLQIVEINGASSESIHIWDRNARLGDAIATLLWQYRTLFRIGAYHRKQGKRTPGLSALISHWLLERRLTRFYPETD
ncbi:MAG: ATP-grasp domain-containing protein [Pseudomonadales bacterium]|nr:ATP-grasp domain-containing protein [Pseudomonadales bacterium]